MVNKFMEALRCQNLLSLHSPGNHWSLGKLAIPQPVGERLLSVAEWC